MEDEMDVGEYFDQQSAADYEFLFSHKIHGPVFCDPQWCREAGKQS